MSAPSITLELFLGGSWVPITDKVRLSAGISVKRGRNNEVSDPDPGTLTFTVDNSDGRFTIGNTAGTYGANFKRWVKCRYTANSSVRFTGYVQSAPATWNDKTRSKSDSAISCIDVLGMMAMSPVASSWADALIGALNPTCWWPLDEPQGSTVAEDHAGTADLAAVAVLGVDGRPGLDDLIAFGTSGPDWLEADTLAQFTPNWDDVELLWEFARLSATIPTITLPCTILAIHTRPAEEPRAVPDAVADVLIPIWSARGAGGEVTLARRLDWPRDVLEVLVRVSATDYAATAPAIFAPDMPVLTAVAITPTAVSILGTSTVAAGWSSAPSLLTGSVFHVGLRDITSSPGSGATAHVAIIPGAMTEADFELLRAKLTGVGTATVATWLNRAALEAGYPGSVSSSLDRIMHRPALKGSNPAAAGNVLAAAAGAVFVADRNGNPAWVDPTYCPPATVLDAHDFAAPMAWDADPSLYYTELHVDNVFRELAAVDQFPKTARNIDGLMTDSDLAAYVDWLAATAGVWGGDRVSGISANLWPMDSTKTAGYLGLDIRSRAAITNEPAQIPTPMVVTVEGCTETVNDKAWTLSFNTAPDPRFVLDESTLDDYYLYE